MEPRDLKCQWLNLRDNKKEEDLDEFEGKGKEEGIE